ncbi:MAG: zinc ABC transporter substrate-binding protein, partial [Serratia symbiotica]|nr:zinc ABC transporter substrate-binding protein [Serratia symbiotica]
MLLKNIAYTRNCLRQAAAFFRPFALLCLLLSASLFSQTALAEKKFRVVTTFTIIQDIAQNVAGDAAVVESITKPGAEIHDYQPTPRDIVKAQHADLILWNGMDLERWFQRFFENIKQVPAAFVTKGITP